MELNADHAVVKEPAFNLQCPKQFLANLPATLRLYFQATHPKRRHNSKL